jgi:hypothetical protein
VWRTGKPDAVLAAAVDTARTAIEGIAKASEIGEHLAARTEGDRVVTHLFESRLPGYIGWQWYAVLTRNSRSKVITVNELGLLPSEDSILAPEWVPWAERVRPEDAQEQDAEDAQDSPEDEEPADGGAADAAPGESAADAESESGADMQSDDETEPGDEAELGAEKVSAAETEQAAGTESGRPDQS